jgi:Tol biopolymer transport system component
MIGTRLGHNRIIEKIGEGGMGAVYRSYDEHLARDVAVKVLTPGALRGEAAHKRFHKEALALSRLNHPNIEIIYDFDTQDGVDYLVMEYIPGLTLKGMLTSGPLPEKEISRLGIQIAEGLAAAHEHKIVHCDLKPGNLMVSRDGRLKILDFGLAKLAPPRGEEGSTDSSVSRSGGGTLPYMAPEQLTGEPPDARTDIYAFGNVLYEMATGRLPFQENLYTALVNAVVHKLPLPPGRLRPELSSRLEEIILKCLEKDPENRYQSAKELIVDLRRLSSSVPSFPVVERPIKRKWPTWRAAVLLAITVLAVFIVVQVSTNKRGEQSIPPYSSLQITRTTAWEEHPAFSPDGNEIAFTSNDSGNLNIYVTDVRGGDAFRLTDDPASDTHPAWFPDGDAIAFTSDREGEKAIWKVGHRGGVATLLVPNAEQASISPDGETIAFCRASSSAYLRVWVAALEAPSDAKILTGDNDGVWDHTDPAWSPDGKTICYGSRHGLWTVSASGGPAKRLTTDAEFDFDPKWSPDGRYVYFASERSGPLAVWRIPVEGGAPQRVTPGTAMESHPDISGNGKWLCYSTGQTSYQTFLLDRKTGHEILLPALESDVMAAISPDNSKIVFPSDRGSNNINLWVLSLNKGIPSNFPYRLTDPPGNVSHPTFSPDGHWIACYRIIKEARDIRTIPVIGGQAIEFSDDSLRDMDPAWSPDGSLIAFVAEEKSIGQLRVAPVKEGRRVGPPRPLTDKEVSASSPVWSPDGRTIAFCGTKDKLSDLWTVPSDGSAPARSITHGLNVKVVRWDHSTGEILASALGRKDRVTLYRVSLKDGSFQPFQPALEFGGADAYGLFDISKDGRFLLSSRIAGTSGHIWVLEATRGVF